MSGKTCPECGSRVLPGEECESYFHQMLYWENERIENGEVHHLTVLCYYLQHPSLYSPDGLRYALDLLDDFLVKEISPKAVLNNRRAQVDSSSRTFKISGRDGVRGTYLHPVNWMMTAEQVVAGGIDAYRENVRTWANSILAALLEAGVWPS